MRFLPPSILLLLLSLSFLGSVEVELAKREEKKALSVSDSGWRCEEQEGFIFIFFQRKREKVVGFSFSPPPSLPSSLTGK